MTLKSFIYAVSLFVISVMVCMLAKTEEPEENKDLLSKYPSFEAENFNGKIYNEQGILTHDLTAGKLSYYKEGDTVLMGNSTLDYYIIKNNRGSEVYRIEAEKVNYKIDRTAELSGNVRLTPSGGRAAGFNEITTPSVNFDVEKNQLTSKENIIIRGASFTIWGNDYVGDLDKKTFIIKENPHARYLPQGR